MHWCQLSGGLFLTGVVCSKLAKEWQSEAGESVANALIASAVAISTTGVTASLFYPDWACQGSENYFKTEWLRRPVELKP